MAQAVFDEHPLEGYLREAGESPLLIPGISAELEQEIDPYFGAFDDASEEFDLEWCPRVVLELLEILQSTLSSVKSQTASRAFVEKFKYNVISSSLLASSLSTTHATRTRSPLSIPGRLQHSTASSMDFDRPPTPPPSPSSDPMEPSYGPVSFIAVFAATSVSLGYPTLSFLSTAATLFLLYNLHTTTETYKHDMTSSLNTLDGLVAANNMWDSVIQDAVTFLDNEERNYLLSSSGPTSPSPIRVALHSCLQTTHTQCDSIRHLFSALTSPAELSQLSEMYAPPSPVKSTFSMEMGARPYSLTSPRSPISPMAYTPTSAADKRSTWNGSYASLGYSGSPTPAAYRRRDRHRLNLSEVFQQGTSSLPNTPESGPLNPVIAELPESPSMEDAVNENPDQFSSIPSNFGAAALDLQRKRKSGGMEAFRTPPPIYTVSDMRSPRSARRNALIQSSSSSKFTNVQPSRYTFSSSALQQTLQGALAAKRYACSHLLALRFEDDDDEGYWEDVRSVMGLLNSTLIDEFSRLTEALTEAQHQNMRDQTPTPLTCTPSMANFENPMDSVASGSDLDDIFKRHKRDISRVSFAPMPTHISRFAAHISAISSALEDARDHLNQCVSALKEDPNASVPSPPPSSKKLPRSRPSGSLYGTPVDGQELEEPPAVQAYERLRRELGLALRECERGRERLMEIVHPPPIPSDDEEDFDDLPGLGHDASDDSDKADPNPLSDDEGDDPAALASRFRTPPDVDAEGGEGGLIDDASTHLLLTTTAQHLPLPGIEEVFEADTGVKVAFSRERSKLSREERIQIAKARRESGMGLSIKVGASTGEGDTSSERMGVEKWGPGGEVVQELKDVIWKVGERRRKMTEPAQQPQDSPETEELAPSPSPSILESS